MACPKSLEGNSGAPTDFVFSKNNLRELEQAVAPVAAPSTLEHEKRALMLTVNVPQLYCLSSKLLLLVVKIQSFGIH